MALRLGPGPVLSNALSTLNHHPARPHGTGTSLITYRPGDQGLPNFRLPFSQAFNFDSHVLPNVGVTYQLNDDQMVYATYAKGFSAPKTDDLYTSATAVVQPESSDNYAVGWRYQSHLIQTSFSLWDVEWKNHIVQSFDPTDPTLSASTATSACDVRHLRPGPRSGRPAIRARDLILRPAPSITKSDVLKANEIVAATSAAASSPLALPHQGQGTEDAAAGPVLLS